MKNAIPNSQHHNEQESNSTTAHSNDHTDHSIANTLPMYASNSVHHMLTDMSPISDNEILNSIMSSSCSTSHNMHSINVHSDNHVIRSNGSSYTANMVHVTYQCWQTILDPIGSLIDGGVKGGLPGTDICMLDYTI